ncbi:MAG: NAD-dependent epimerase/dehydratase family protein [Dokdonella sp.]
MKSETAKSVRVIVVGAGYVANHHLAALRRLDFVEVVGLCDSNVAAAELLAKKFEVTHVAASLADLAHLQANAVYVLTPPASHAPLALQALAMGCHVLVEKPMADTVAECDAMLAAAQAQSRILGVNHSDLFDPVILRALGAVRAGRIGELVSVDVLRSSDYPAYAGGPLPGQVAQGSYPFRDLGVHGLYLLEALLGQVRQLSVQPRSSSRNPDLHFDEWSAEAECEHGVGRLLLSWNARPMENRVIVRGTQGQIVVDRFLQTCHIHRQLPGPKFIGIVLNTWLSAAADLFRVPWNVLRFATGMLKPSPGIQRGAIEFAEAVRDGKPAPFTGADARRIVALMEPACVGPDRLRREEIEARYQPLPACPILVTGAAGFLGRKLVAALRARGEHVRVLVRRPVAAFSSDEGVQQVIGNLGDPRAVDHAVQGTHLVYHVGAAMRGSARDFEAGTVWGTRNTVAACLRHDIGKLVYVSSLSVLDHAGRDAAIPITEQSALEPYPERRGAYTQTKLSAENCVREAIREHGLRAVILRPGQIFGPGAERSTPNGALSLAGRWIAVGEPSQTLPLVYVDDVLDALLLASDNDAALGKTFHVVDHEALAQGDYLRRVQNKLGSELKQSRVSTRLFMTLAHGVEMLGRLLKREVPLTRYRVQSLRPLANFDLSAAHETLGWNPRIGVRNGLDITFGEDAP